MKTGTGKVKCQKRDAGTATWMVCETVAEAIIALQEASAEDAKSLLHAFNTQRGTDAKNKLRVAFAQANGLAPITKGEIRKRAYARIGKAEWSKLSGDADAIEARVLAEMVKIEAEIKKAE